MAHPKGQTAKYVKSEAAKAAQKKYQQTEKFKAYQREYQLKNKLKIKAWHKNYYLQKEYGIGLEQYNALFEAQKGCCAICGRHQIEIGATLAVDHNHATGVVRELLCTACNQGIGLLKENTQILLKAIEYLKKHGGK
mgnify:CR=1 FL=1